MKIDKAKKITQMSEYRITFWMSIGLIVLLTACGNKEIKSKWRTDEITVDGSNRDWAGNLVYNRDNDISIGIVNDESDLYISISSTDRGMIQKVISGGFTVWFNTKGNRDKTIGIRYPIGMRGAATPFPERLEGYENKNYPNEQPIESFRKRWEEFEIIKDKEDISLRIPIDNEVGIEVSYSFYEGTFVYELKLPLNEDKDSPYAIRAGASELIGIGFETGKMENRNRMNRMNRRGFSGGRGGRGGGGGRRMNAGNFSRTMEPLRYWIKVELAKADI